MPIYKIQIDASIKGSGIKTVTITAESYEEAEKTLNESLDDSDFYFEPNDMDNWEFTECDLTLLETLPDPPDPNQFVLSLIPES